MNSWSIEALFNGFNIKCALTAVQIDEIVWIIEVQINED